MTAKKSGKKERRTSTIKITPDLLDSINRAAEYYGNVSALSKMMGVAHSTIIFWRNGKTSSMSGRLWVTRVRPVLEPFLPSSKINISDTHGQYTPQFPVVPPYMDIKKVERHQVNVLPVSVLKTYDPALESASAFVRARCTEKRTFYHECRRSAFALKIDSLFTDVFPENCYILAYPDGLQNGCMVICKLQDSQELLARKYTKENNVITLSVLPGGTGEDIQWNCEEEIGHLSWCFPLVELNLDLLPCMGVSSFDIDNDDIVDAYGNIVDRESGYNIRDNKMTANSPPKRRGRKRKNVPAPNQ